MTTEQPGSRQTPQDEPKPQAKEKPYEIELDNPVAVLIKEQIRCEKLENETASKDVDIARLRETVLELQIERDGWRTSSISWEELHAKRHEEVESIRARLATAETKLATLQNNEI